MNPNIKSTKAEVAALYKKGSERVVEVSKSSMDSAVQQSSEILVSYKKASPVIVSFLFDLTSHAVEGYATLQKGLLDLTVEQSSAVIEASQEYSSDPSKAKDVFTGLFLKSVDRAVAAQTSILNFAAKQTKTASDMVKQQSGVAGTAVESLTDSVQQGVDSAIAAQKEFLNLASKNLKATTAKL
jgi:hypothetical protein